MTARGEHARRAVLRAELAGDELRIRRRANAIARAVEDERRAFDLPEPRLDASSAAIHLERGAKRIAIVRGDTLSHLGIAEVARPELEEIPIGKRPPAAIAEA